MKNKKTQKSNTPFIIIGLLLVVWLVGLTAFTAWAWNMHIWQAGVDNDAIYQLTVENAKQQQIIEDLQK